MSVITQRTYAPQLRRGLVGMVSDMVPYAIVTRINESNNLPFGVAVSRGTIDKGCVIGGTAAKFLGISTRDITLSRSPIDPFAVDGVLNPLDAYGPRVNVGVLTRGHIWVLAGAAVADGDPLYFDEATGGLSNAATGLASYGSIQFTSNPSDGNTITINAVPITFKASGATGDNVNIGPTLGDTISALAAKLSGSATTGIAALRYSASPPSPGGSAQGSGADTLLISQKTLGVAGNAIAIDASGTPGATASGATLTGGLDGCLLANGGTWLDRANAGQIARVSLALQG